MKLTDAERNELAMLRERFDSDGLGALGGRGVEVAERIDELERKQRCRQVEVTLLITIDPDEEEVDVSRWSWGDLLDLLDVDMSDLDSPIIKSWKDVTDE